MMDRVDAGMGVSGVVLREEEAGIAHARRQNRLLL
jgi:hypothetical protein